MSTLSLNPVDSLSSIQVGEPTTDVGAFLYFTASRGTVRFSGTGLSLQELGEITVAGANVIAKGYQRGVDTLSAQASSDGLCRSVSEMEVWHRWIGGELTIVRFVPGSNA